MAFEKYYLLTNMDHGGLIARNLSQSTAGLEFLNLLLRSESFYYSSYDSTAVRISLLLRLKVECLCCSILLLVIFFCCCMSKILLLALVNCCSFETYYCCDYCLKRWINTHMGYLIYTHKEVIGFVRKRLKGSYLDY